MTLAKDLFDRGTLLTGTIIDSRRDFPASLKKGKEWGKGKPKETMRWVRDAPVLALQWVDNKAVSMITTAGNANETTQVNRKRETGGTWNATEVRQPGVFHMYNQYMNAVDRSDQILATHNVQRKCMRWWKTLFFHLIDLAVVNSFILFKEQQRKFPDNEALRQPAKYSLASYQEELIRNICDLPAVDRPPTNESVRPSTLGAFDVTHSPIFLDVKRQCVVCVREGRGRFNVYSSCSAPQCQGLHMQLDSNFSNIFECLGAKITTPNSTFYVAAVYHPPEPQYCPVELLDHLTNSCDRLLTDNPNSNLIICGDLNQLDYKDFLTQLNLLQMVKTPTRKDKILDVFITNVPHFWRKVSVAQGLVRSDHSVALVYPRIPLKAERKTVMFRDVRDHHKLKMDNLLKCYNWDIVYQCKDVNEKLDLLSTNIKSMFDECFPSISVRVSNKDPPFFSPLVKHLLEQRRKLIRRKNMDTSGLIEIQTLQDKINKLIRDSQVQAVKGNFEKHSTGSKSWWSTVNSLTGRKSTNTPISSIISPNEINNFFCTVNTDPHYKSTHAVVIPESCKIPALTVSCVTECLLKLKKTASGPDKIPYWIWKEFAYDLAPVVTHIFNCSLENHIVPDLWKLSDITPLPKESNFKNCTQLRPISLTNVIMRVFERLVYRQELSQYVNNFIDLDQFAYRKGHNTTMALIKCQYAWLKWLDSGFDFVRIFSFDFSKAFDSVPHDILCSKLKSLDINPYVTNWIISFLQGRKQRVTVDGIVTDYLNINRGVPQGTVLGPILFSIMVNDIKVILPNQNLLVKFADDLTLSIPVKSGVSNSNSAAYEVQSIVEWTIVNRMQLNFKKTWEMLLKGKSTKALPAPLVSIERKPSLKLLGVTFQSDPCNWDLHLDNILSKASSRLHILRVCKFYGLPLDDLHILFTSLILPTLTYAVEVWGCAYYHKYLSRIDRLFKRAFKFGYCKERFFIENIIALKDKKLWDKITDSNLITALDDLLPPKRTLVTSRKRRHNYIIPLVRTERFKRTFINRCLFSS